MDSAGVGELAGAYVPVKSKSGELKFLNPTKKVHVMLKITQQDRVFEVYIDEETAMRNFPESAGERVHEYVGRGHKMM
jgi:anti-anti-sigma regulatory factor